MENMENKVIEFNGERETRVVKNRRIAYELRKLGYKILRTEPNKFRPELDVYIFKNEKGLKEELNRLCEDYKERRDQNIA